MEIMAEYPEAIIVCNAKSLALLRQFFDAGFDSRVMIVAENDVLETGRHTLRFFMAPMVHWPEVMVTYDSADKTLFSADAFGCFGALNGALFADEVDFAKDYMDEARRYYTNIVGKYGPQAAALLDKASSLDIAAICPLHGFVWRKKIDAIVSKYRLWSEYEPEERGAMIAYASVYGNTEKAAELLACMLRNKGVKTEMYDVSVTPASEIVSAAFRWSHLVFASTTYNAGIFVSMEELLNDLAAHNIQKRAVGFIENGSWAAASGGLMRKKLEACKDIGFLNGSVSLKSGVKRENLAEIESLADEIASQTRTAPAAGESGGRKPGPSATINAAAMFKLSYGLFVLTARDGDRDNGCIINTAAQITSAPLRISITVNKANYTHDMILKTGVFNVSVLSESAPFGVFRQFGFQSGKDADKFADSGYDARAGNGVRYLPEYANCAIAAKVTESHGYETHTLFVAEVTEAFVLSGEPSVTYQYYFDNIKPKPQKPKDRKKGFVCKICGYVYEGDSLPDGYICPICKHGADDFEPL
jgi:flavorubredoxin/flavin reductase (DIM6/NTAB) family NADH-FMN oxidoreductase RutF/rubredoxin